MPKKPSGLAFAAVLLLAIASSGFQNKPDGEWPAYGGDPGGQRFSPLASINGKNVQSLQVAWVFRTGDAYQPRFGRPTAFEATPLYAGGMLYIGTPLGRIIALDPAPCTQLRPYHYNVPNDKCYGALDN